MKGQNALVAKILMFRFQDRNAEGIVKLGIEHEEVGLSRSSGSAVPLVANSWVSLAPSKEFGSYRESRRAISAPIEPGQLTDEGVIEPLEHGVGG